MVVATNRWMTMMFYANYRRGNARRTGPADFSAHGFSVNILHGVLSRPILYLSPLLLSLRQPPTLITWKCLRRIEAGLFKEWSLNGRSEPVHRAISPNLFGDWKLLHASAIFSPLPKAFLRRFLPFVSLYCFPMINFPCYSRVLYVKRNMYVCMYACLGEIVNKIVNESCKQKNYNFYWTLVISLVINDFSRLPVLLRLFLRLIYPYPKLYLRKKIRPQN